MLTSLLFLFALLAVLLWINRWISAHLQGVGLLLTGRTGAGQVLLFFVMMPGVILHEASHWLVAWLLGLQPGAFRVGLRQTKNGLQMGYVTFRSGGPLLDSLVGVAPFLSGSILLSVLSLSIFEINRLVAVIAVQHWGQAAGLAWGLLYTPDVWLWVYLIFVVSNSMLPSASDRRPWRTVGVYAAILLVLAYVFNLFPLIPSAWAEAALEVLSSLTTAFGLTVVIDLIFAGLILLFERFLGWLRGGSVIYH